MPERAHTICFGSNMICAVSVLTTSACFNFAMLIKLCRKTFVTVIKSLKGTIQIPSDICGFFLFNGIVMYFLINILL